MNNRRINVKASNPFEMLGHLMDSLGGEFAQVSSYTYPPHNVVHVADGQLEIQISVAGFSKNDLSVSETDSILKVTGSKKDSSEVPVYLYKGLATRSFELKWKMPPEMEVSQNGVSVIDGILTIKLHTVERPNKVKKFDIT